MIPASMKKGRGGGGDRKIAARDPRRVVGDFAGRLQSAGKTPLTAPRRNVTTRGVKDANYR